MILPIYLYGHPVLRRVAEDVETADKEEITQFVADMYETLEKTGGIGLAAPQVGRSARIVIVDLRPLAEDFPEYADFKRTYINSHIVDYNEDKDTSDEGCLSVPGISEKVIRPTKIRIQYLDDKFEPHDEWVSGYLARVIQHESDHLEGKMFVDRLSPLRKQMIKKKLNNILKGIVSCNYKVKFKK